MSMGGVAPKYAEFIMVHVVGRRRVLSSSRLGLGVSCVEDRQTNSLVSARNSSVRHIQ